MSRTNKDKPYWKRMNNLYANPNKENSKRARALEPNERELQRKTLDTEYHWMSTPSWWNNLFHNRPERRKAHEFSILASKAEDLEELDYPNLKHKPHKYYW